MHDQFEFKKAPPGTLFVLGAADPEMDQVSRVLKSRGVSFAWASKGGKKCSWGNAYKADGLCDDWEAEISWPEPGTPVVLVECGGEKLENEVVWARADHHLPGHHGYGAPAEKAWEACSLSQVLAMVSGYVRYEYDRERFTWYGVDEKGGKASVPSHLVMVGSADHNLPAAFAGKCPGVSPLALEAYRDPVMASNMGVKPDEFAVVIEQAKKQVLGAEEIVPGIKDMRRSGRIPALAEACARLGVAAVSEAEERNFDKKITGRRKWCLMGAPEPEPVRWFLEEFAPNHGLLNPYGDPARGFAAGYLPDELAADGFEWEAREKPEDPTSASRLKMAKKLRKKAV